MGSSASFHLTFKPEAEGVLRDRWSDRSPQEGTEECVCSWCGKMIGRDERDPVWKDHIKWCAGCEVCEIALRMWKDDPNKQGEVLELRFHPKCVSEIIVPKNGT
jgi:hypothetical protein